jgi:uncharacterized membrane protein
VAADEGRTRDGNRLAALEARVSQLEARLGPVPREPATETLAMALAPMPVAIPMAADAVPATAAPTQAAATPRGGWSGSVDEQLSTRLLAWAGGIALVIGALFFLSLAFSRGWIGAEARVLIGLVAGGVALAVGTWLFDRGLGTPARVTIGVGIGVGSLALFAGDRSSTTSFRSSSGWSGSPSSRSPPR